MSPEAAAAADLFNAVQDNLAERLSECVGARELTSLGFHADVEVATALNVSSAVPVLSDGAFGLADGLLDACET